MARDAIALYLKDGQDFVVPGADGAIVTSISVDEPEKVSA